jgi:ubiquinone/menaquinone biosynthesis C-methylase UbiE
MTVDHTRRFDGRVDAYRRFRPTYPREIVDFLGERCALTTNSVIADVGAGTGLLSELFLRNGNSVFAIEPNDEMRSACKELEATYPHLASVKGTAECTCVADHSIDFVAVGRAFHWFDEEKCLKEFRRILKPSGWLAILNLGRREGREPLLQDYDELLVTHGSDYAAVRAKHDLVNTNAKFFSDGEVHHVEFSRVEELSYETLEGRTLSMSVMPLPGNSRFPAMKRALEDYFCRYESNGRIKIPLICHLYVGQLSHPAITMTVTDEPG